MCIFRDLGVAWFVSKYSNLFLSLKPKLVSKLIFYQKLANEVYNFLAI